MFIVWHFVSGNVSDESAPSRGIFNKPLLIIASSTLRNYLNSASDGSVNSILEMKVISNGT